MCPNCGLTNVHVSSWLKRDDGETAVFSCADCGWKGGPKEFRVPCTKCGDSVPWSEIELDAECNVVCRVCYLKDPPPEDIAGMFHDTFSESNLNGGEFSDIVGLIN